MSAIERAAVARTSTRVSSISRMIIRIIRAGSSARSRSSVMSAAKMSRARLNTGPLNQAATGASREEAVSGCVTSTGVRTGTFASRISSSRIGLNLERVEGVGIRLGGADGRADRNRAHDECRGDGDQGAGEGRLRRHFYSPFLTRLLFGWPMPLPNQGACQSRKTAKNSCRGAQLGDFANQELVANPKQWLGTF